MLIDWLTRPFVRLVRLPDPVLPVSGPMTIVHYRRQRGFSDADLARFRRAQEDEARKPTARAWRGHIFAPDRFAPRPFNRAGCGFAISYYARPWEAVLDAWRELGQMWHRARYGWAPEDTWSLDHTLAEVLPSMLRYLKDHRHTLGYFPEREDLLTADADQAWSDIASQQADAWLEAMASAWDTYRGLLAGSAPSDDPRWEQVHAAFRDLVDHLEYLWD